MPKPALFFRKLGPRQGTEKGQTSISLETVQCELCPHHCIIPPGKTGICGIRKNTGGRLVTFCYEKICAVDIDPIEKKPLFHFLPGTKTLSIATRGCNLRCLNCQNWQISQITDGAVLSINPEHASDTFVELAIKSKSKSISYTYTEPTIFYELMIETAKKAKKAGLKNIIVSNGYIEEKPLTELCKYIDAANIDLKAFSNDIYIKLSGGKLEPVMKSLKILKMNKVWLEITNLVIPSFSDNINSCKEMCKWICKELGAETPLHFSRFYPMYKLKDISPTSIKTLIEMKKTALRQGLKYVYIGNVSKNEADTEPFEDTICPKCNKTVIKREGFFVRETNLKKGYCSCGEKIPGVWK